jgi:hypothetical protein
MKSRIAWLVVLAAVAVLVKGCGDGATPNGSPQVGSLTSDAAEVSPDGSCTLTCTATDPEGHGLSFDWSCSGGTITGSGASVNWTAPDTPGTYTVTVIVSDGTSSATSTVDIEVVNNPPTVTEISADRTPFHGRHCVDSRQGQRRRGCG